MKRFSKTLVAILLVFSFAVSLAGCSKTPKITTRMENVVKTAIRTGEEYLRGQKTASDAHDVIMDLSKEASEIAEGYNNEKEWDLYKVLLSASTDVLLLGTSISTGTESDIKDKIAELEEYLN